MNRIKEKLNNSYHYRKIASRIHRFFVRLNPKIEMKRVYRNIFGKTPNLEEPHNLVEKTYWLQLYTDTSMWTKCADKYAFRDYVNSLGLGEYLPKLLKKWDDPEEISFTDLPEKFILKTNNGCAQCMIIQNKKDVNIEEVKIKFNQWISIPYGYAGAQLHYTKIVPCVIAEELLLPSKEELMISPSSLIDYKVWCFHGLPECIWVAYNRHNGSCVDMNLYDLSWRSMPQFLKTTKTDIYRPDIIIPKPQCLDEMLEIAAKLSKPFEEVRVDFYVIQHKPIIGEMTFTAGYGFFTDDYYEYLGQKIDLSKAKLKH